ncbi:MAG: hypothetical protein QOF58_649 [Pseudonocardiales bacterium]|jgi:hypothetical protein|nr:hypothetical protein [Pseudonocardiales bacterium]
MNPAQRTARAQIAADCSWAQTKDRAARTAPARAAAEDRFYKLVDPNGEMSPADREKAAGNARRAFYRGIAMKRWAKRTA